MPSGFRVSNVSLTDGTALLSHVGASERIVTSHQIGELIFRDDSEARSGFRHVGEMRQGHYVVGSEVRFEVGTT